MGRMIVNYGSQKREVYSSTYLKWQIKNHKETPSYQAIIQRFLDDERVTSIEVEHLAFLNLKLREDVSRCPNKELTFTGCRFLGDLTLEDIHDLSFDRCDIGCVDSDIDLSSDRMTMQDSTISFADCTFTANNSLAFLHSETRDFCTDLNLETPKLYFDDSEIDVYELTWKVKEVCGSVKEGKLKARNVNYFEIPLDNYHTSGYEAWIGPMNQSQTLPQLSSYYQLMGIAKFLENKGYQLISQIQEAEVGKQYQEHLQGTDETNLKEVFSVLDQPYSMPYKKDLEKETIPQLVKRLKREN